jgi:hypothetical protein
MDVRRVDMGVDGKGTSSGAQPGLGGRGTASGITTGLSPPFFFSDKGFVLAFRGTGPGAERPHSGFTGWDKVGWLTPLVLTTAFRAGPAAANVALGTVEAFSAVDLLNVLGCADLVDLVDRSGLVAGRVGIALSFREAGLVPFVFSDTSSFWIGSGRGTLLAPLTMGSGAGGQASLDDVNATGLWGRVGPIDTPAAT